MFLRYVLGLQRGSLRFLQWSNDSNESEAFKRYDVQRVLQHLSALPLRHGECWCATRLCRFDLNDGMFLNAGQLTKRAPRWSNAGHAAQVPQLDSSRLHLRNETHQHAHLQVPQRAALSQHHTQVLDGNR